MVRYFKARLMVYKAVALLIMFPLNVLLADDATTLETSPMEASVTTGVVENTSAPITTEESLSPTGEQPVHSTASLNTLLTLTTVTPWFNSSTPTETFEISTADVTKNTTTFQNSTTAQMSNSSDVTTTATSVWYSSLTPTQTIENSSEPQLDSSTIIPTETYNSTTEQPDTSTFILSTTNIPLNSSVTPTESFYNSSTEQPDNSTFISNTTNTPFSTFATPTETFDNFTTDQPDNFTFLPNTTNTPFSGSVIPTEALDNFTTGQPDNSTFLPNTTNTPFSGSVTPTETYDNRTTEQPDNSTFLPNTTNTPFSGSVTPTEALDNFTTGQPDNSTFLPNTTSTPFSSSVTPTETYDNFTTEQPGNSTFLPNTTNTPFSSSVAPTEIFDNFTTEQPDNATFIMNTTNTPFSSSVTPTETFDNFTTEQPDNSTFIMNITNTPSSNFTTPPFETSTTEEAVTGTFFTLDTTEMTTDFTSEQTTRSASPSPEAATSGPTDTPNVPSDQPPIFKNAPEKTIRVELAISEASTTCQPELNSSSKQCQELIVNFNTEVQALYSVINGFLRVNILQLSKGSVIITHTAVYNYTAMTPGDQSLTGQLVFDRTVGQAVSGGMLGNLTVVNCTNCNPPNDISDFCSLISQGLATCADPVLQPQCVNDYVICRSPCKGSPDYCNQRGVCSQANDAEPVCWCVDTTEAWHSGARCEIYVNKVWVIVGVCFGAGFLIIVVAIVAYLCCRRCKNRNLSRDRNRSFLPGDDSDGYVLSCHSLGDSLVPGRSGPSNHVTTFSGGYDGPAMTFVKHDERKNEYTDLTEERQRPQPQISSYSQDVPVVNLCMDDSHGLTGGLDAAVKQDTPPTPKALENVYF